MEIINKFGAIVGIGALLLGGFVYLYSTAKRGRQDILRQDNSDLRASNQEMRTERVGLEATIKEQRDSINHLRDIATQTPAVTKLIEMNTRQQKQISDQHSEVVGGLTHLTNELSKLVTEFSVLSRAINASNKRGRDNEK